MPLQPALGFVYVAGVHDRFNCPGNQKKNSFQISSTNRGSVNFSYLMLLKKFSNISTTNASHSRSSITKHDLTFATVSSIETAFI